MNPTAGSSDTETILQSPNANLRISAPSSRTGATWICTYGVLTVRNVASSVDGHVPREIKRYTPTVSGSIMTYLAFPG
ncbi:hypothetical protein EYR40_005798 [Pleurotus pulmonarius]|nr:hypothetical protein EYR40_005798 [Pleurotus pulmonarius]